MDLSLNMIADAIQVPLSLLKSAISGEREVKLTTTLEGLVLDLRLRAIKASTYKQLAVLFHVKGNLWLLVAHNREVVTGATSLYVIDAAKCEMDGVMCKPDSLVLANCSLRENIDSLGEAVVRSYFRQASKTWVPFKLP